jgi:hypothetical protein
VHDVVVNKAVALTLRDAMKGKDSIDFPKPSIKMAFGDQRGVPDVTCQDVGAAQSKLRDAGFTPQVSSQTEASKCPAGKVARTDPSGNTVKGGVVVIYLSNGQGAGGTPTPGGGRNGGGGNIVLPCPPFCRQG